MQKTNTTIQKETGKNIFTSSQLSMFNILHELENDVKLLNIWKSYTIRDNIKESISYYDTYIVQHSDWWDNIAYKVYGDVTYWWTIALMNNITNPFEELKVGTQIAVLKKKYLYQLLKEIKAVATI